MLLRRFKILAPKIDYLKLLKDTFEFSWRVSYQKDF